MKRILLVSIMVLGFGPQAWAQSLPWGPGPALPSGDTDLGMSIRECQNYGLSLMQRRDPSLGASQLQLGTTTNQAGLPNLRDHTLYGDGMVKTNDGWTNLSFQCLLAQDFRSVSTFNYNLRGTHRHGSPGYNHNNYERELANAIQVCEPYGLSAIRSDDRNLGATKLLLGPDTNTASNAQPDFRNDVLSGNGMVHGYNGWRNLRFECTVDNHQSYVMRFTYHFDNVPQPAPNPWPQPWPGPAPSPDVSHKKEKAEDACKADAQAILANHYRGESVDHLRFGRYHNNERQDPSLNGNHLSGIGEFRVNGDKWQNFHFDCWVNNDYSSAVRFEYSLR